MLPNIWADVGNWTLKISQSGHTGRESECEKEREKRVPMGTCDLPN